MKFIEKYSHWFVKLAVLMFFYGAFKFNEGLGWMFLGALIIITIFTLES